MTDQGIQQYLEPGELLVDYRRGRNGWLTVARRGHFLRLRINHAWQGEDRQTHQLLAAHLPMLLAPDPKRVAVVGIGAGQTCSRFLMYEIQQLCCIDIEPELIPLLRAQFESNWLGDPRVTIAIGDGRDVLAQQDEAWDLISLEVGQLNSPAAAAFYTLEFYELARRRLSAAGLLAICLPLPFLSTAQFRAAARTFREVFPASALFYNTSELLLIGSCRGDPPQSACRWQLLDKSLPLHQDLSYAHWGGPQQGLNQPKNLAACFLLGPAGLAKIAGGAALCRTGDSVLDAVSGQDLQDEEQQSVACIRSALDPIESFSANDWTAAEISAAEQLRQRNLDNIEVSARLRGLGQLVRGSGRAAAMRMLAELSRINPEHSEVARLLGDLCDEEGQLDSALQHYQRALSINPENVEANYGCGLIHHKRGQPAEAQQAYERALLARPKYAKVLNNLGTACIQQNHVEQAIGHFRAAAELDPGNPSIRQNWARAHSRLGVLRAGERQYQQAREQFQSALAIDPSLTEAQDYLNRLQKTDS